MNTKKIIKLAKKNKKDILLGSIIFLVLLGVCGIGYQQGKADQKHEYEQQIKQEQDAQATLIFMKLPYETAKEVFIKGLMIKTILWLKPILVVLGIGYILRSIFR